MKEKPGRLFVVKGDEIVVTGLFGLTLRRCRVPLTLLTFSFASRGKLAWL